MIEIWWKALDVGVHAGNFLTDFCKAFDCIDHELLQVKFNPYGLNSKSLYFL